MNEQVHSSQRDESERDVNGTSIGTRSLGDVLEEAALYPDDVVVMRHMSKKDGLRDFGGDSCSNPDQSCV